MKPVKMITIDLDGTLLRSDGSVSDRTVRTLQAARDKGVVVAIATGRMYQTARPYGDRLDLGDSPLLLFAGGLIETLESKKILFQQAIPQQTAQELVDLAREKGWQMQTYIDDVLRTAKDDKWIRGYEEITHSKACICGDEFYRVQGDCNKLLSRGEHDDLVARKALIEERFPVSSTSSFPCRHSWKSCPAASTRARVSAAWASSTASRPMRSWPSEIPRTIWICSKPPVSPWPWPMLPTK